MVTECIERELYTWNDGMVTITARREDRGVYSFTATVTLPPLARGPEHERALADTILSSFDVALDRVLDWAQGRTASPQPPPVAESADS